MANTRSARKRIRANERKHVRNRSIRAAVRTKVTKARRTLLTPAEGTDAAEDVKAAIQALDRAAEKGVLHANNARRRKSRLASMAAALQKAGQEGGDAIAARSAAAGGAKGRSAKSTAKASAKKPAKAKTAAKAPAAKAPAAKSSRSAAGTAKTARKR